MGWKNDSKRKEPPRRQPPFKPTTTTTPITSVPHPMDPDAPLTPISSKPAPVTPTAPKPVSPEIQVPTPLPSTSQSIPYTTNPRWCKPKAGCPAKWLEANAYGKVFLFPGSKIELSAKGGPDGKGIYRDSVPGECIWLYKSVAMTRDNPSGTTFVDDTTEELFRQWFDFGI